MDEIASEVEILAGPRQGIATPALFAGSPHSTRRFWEFFTAEIPNDNTRRAYFAAWCDQRQLDQRQLLVAAHPDRCLSQAPAGQPGGYQREAAFGVDTNVVRLSGFRQVVPMNPAASVVGPSTWSPRAKLRC